MTGPCRDQLEGVAAARDATHPDDVEARRAVAVEDGSERDRPERRPGETADRAVEAGGGRSPGRARARGRAEQRAPPPPCRPPRARRRRDVGTRRPPPSVTS